MKGDADDDIEWKTMNGTHIPFKDGEPQGEVGQKVKATSKPKEQGATQGASKSPKQQFDVAKPQVTEADKEMLEKKARHNQYRSEDMLSTVQETNADDWLKSEFGSNQMTTSEFVEMSQNAFQEFSEQDRLLDTAYTMDASTSLGTDSFILNQKMRDGAPLSETEQAIVQHFTDVAAPLGKDTDLYRMVGSDYVEQLLGQQLSLPPTFFTPLDDATQSAIRGMEGREIVSNQLQSTSPGISNYFDDKNVAIRIKTPGNVPVSMTTDVSEGEIVIPVGARMKVTRAEYVQPKTDAAPILPVWNSGRVARGFGESAGMGPDAGGSMKMTGNIYIEMELMGYE